MSARPTDDPLQPDDPPDIIDRRHLLPWWTYIDWPGAVAFVLALGVSAALVFGFIGSVLQGEPIDQPLANLLSTLGGAAVGAVATYLGINRRTAATRRTDHAELRQWTGVERRGVS